MTITFSQEFIEANFVGLYLICCFYSLLAIAWVVTEIVTRFERRCKH